MKLSHLVSGFAALAFASSAMGCASFSTNQVYWHFADGKLVEEGVGTPPSQVPNRIVWVDSAFSPEDVANIRLGVRQWGLSLAQFQSFQVSQIQEGQEMRAFEMCGSGASWCVMKIDSGNMMLRGQASAPGHNLMAVSKQGGNNVYLIRDRIPEGYMSGVVVHELGHLMGAPHTTHGLMAEGFELDRSGCVDLPTAITVAEMHGYPLNKMGYCTYQ